MDVTVSTTTIANDIRSSPTATRGVDAASVGAGRSLLLATANGTWNPQPFTALCPWFSSPEKAYLQLSTNSVPRLMTLTSEATTLASDTGLQDMVIVTLAVPSREATPRHAKSLKATTPTSPKRRSQPVRAMSRTRVKVIQKCESFEV